MHKFMLSLGAVALFSLVATANAQFTPPDQSQQQSGANPAFGQQAPFSNITTKFDGIEVLVSRLLRDPTSDGAIRLVFQLKNSSDKDRRMLFLGPVATLVDEMGNTYEAIDTVGIEPCIYNHKWYPEVKWCADQFGNIATRLAPDVPVTVAIRFKPASGYSEELAKMSNGVSLRARLAHYSDELKEGKTADIIVNNIPFPRP